MPSVSDVRSNPNDQIAHAARIIAGPQCRAVFAAIYRGKRSVKSVSDLASATGLTRKQVLTAGLALAKNEIVLQLKDNGQTAYRKDAFYSHHRDRILALAADPKKLKALPTKVTPHIPQSNLHFLPPVPKEQFHVREITVEDIDSFDRVVGVVADNYTAMPEEQFKRGFQNILGDAGAFQDWGGEPNDLMTTLIRISGQRVRAAIAFKGPGTKGRLTPAKMGKNGDQIQRLFQTSARLFLVQYWGQVDQAVYDQMNAYAVHRSVATGDEILYGVIDGLDSTRLIKAFADCFSDTKVHVNVGSEV